MTCAKAYLLTTGERLRRRLGVIAWMLAAATAGCAPPFATAAVVHGRLRAYATWPPESPEGAALQAEMVEVAAGVLPRWPPSVEWAVEIASLRERAARDFACDLRSVEVLRFGTGCQALVEACGKRDVYLWIDTSVPTDDAPGLEGRRVTLTTGLFFPIAMPLDAAKREALRMTPRSLGGEPPIASICLVAEGEDRYGLLADVNERASRDLACPRNEVFPGFTRSSRYPSLRNAPGVFAEGCGKRVDYSLSPASKIVGIARVQRVDPPPAAPSLEEATPTAP